MTRRSFFGVLLTPVLASADQPRVAFLRPPSIVQDQYAVTYRVRVPIHDDNRLLAIAAFEGDIRVQYTERDLGSEGRKTIWDVTWRLPPGEIVLVAAVFGNGGEIDRATHRVQVIPWGL